MIVRPIEDIPCPTCKRKRRQMCAPTRGPTQNGYHLTRVYARAMIANGVRPLEAYRPIAQAHAPAPHKAVDQRRAAVAG